MNRWVIWVFLICMVAFVWDRQFEPKMMGWIVAGLLAIAGILSLTTDKD